MVRGQDLNSGVLIPEEDGDAVIVDRPEWNTVFLDDNSELSSLDALLHSRGLLNANKPAIVVQTGLGVVSSERGTRSDGTDLGPIPFFSGLINGRGRFQNTHTPLSEFIVSPDTYTIFRLIGGTTNTPYDFSIDRHTLRVIATDGSDVGFRDDIIDADFVSVYPGERYDVLVAANATIGNYWMRAESQQVNVPDGMEFSARAILSYEGAESLDWRNGYLNVPEMPHREMCTQENPCSNLNCPSEVVPNRTCISLLELVPRPMKPASELPKFPPTCLDCVYYLDFGGTQDFGATVNRIKFERPTEPYQTIAADNTTLTTAPRVMPIPARRTVQH